MKTFTDTEGRTWNIDIHVTAVKRVRSLTGVNIASMSGEGIIALANDPEKLCDVIFALVKPQADEKNITDEDFGRAMRGDPIEHATNAFLEELVNFTPSPAGRKILGLALDQSKDLHETAMAKLAEHLEKGTAKQALTEKLDNILK